MLLFLLLLLLLLPFPPLEKGGWGDSLFDPITAPTRKSESPAHRSSARNESAPALAPFYKVGADFRARHRQGAGLSSIGLASIDPARIAIRNPRLLLFPPFGKGGLGGFAFRSGRHAKRKSESPAHRSSARN